MASRLAERGLRTRQRLMGDDRRRVGRRTPDSNLAASEWMDLNCMTWLEHAPKKDASGDESPASHAAWFAVEPLDMRAGADTALQTMTSDNTYSRQTSSRVFPLREPRSSSVLSGILSVHSSASNRRQIHRARATGAIGTEQPELR